MYGILCFAKDGRQTDLNLDSALITEGVLILGNADVGMITIDMLYPLREQFRGCFLLPVAHSFANNWMTEHATPVFWKNGRLCWQITYHSEDLWRGIDWSGGAFMGRQFVYGYFN